MADHQPNPDDQQPDAEVAPDTSAQSSTDDKQVPLSELVKMRQAKSAAEEKTKELEARLAEFENQQTSTEPKSANNAINTEDPNILHQLLRKDRLRDLRTDEGLTGAQAEKVLDLMDSMPGLQVHEARNIAASRHEDLFSESGEASTGFDAGVHGSTRPVPGSQPEPERQSDTPERLAFVKNTMSKNKDLANRVWNNVIGSIAAEQVGRQGHQRIKLPKT